MIQTENNFEISVIQGDSYCLELDTKNVDSEIIKDIYFSSKYLGVCKKLRYDKINEVYTLELTPEDTRNFLTGEGDYDITVHFIGDAMETTLYRSTLKILRKSN